MKTNTSALLALAVTALLWSSGGLAIKTIDWNPFAITGMRSLLAALLLFAYFKSPLYAKTGEKLRFTFSRWQLGGGLAYAGMLTTNVVATKLTTSANAILLAYTAPIYVALLAPWLLKEHTRRSDWFFILICTAGIVLFFLDKLTLTGLQGNCIAISTGVCYALFTICMRAQRSAALQSILLGHCITALICSPFLFNNPPGIEGWLGLAYLGFLQQGVSLILYAWCISRVKALEAILVLTLEPILNPVWVAIGYGELPGHWAMIGGAVVVLTITARGVLATKKIP